MVRARRCLFAVPLFAVALAYAADNPSQQRRPLTPDDFYNIQVVSDPHSPRQFRVNGPARNIDAWYQVFQVKPEDKLFVAPAERVRIW